MLGGQINDPFGERSTGNDRFSGDRFSGNDRFSGTKTPDDAILFTVSGITVIVEQKFQKFRIFFPQNFDVDLRKVGILKPEVIKNLLYFEKIRCITIFSFFMGVKRTLCGSVKPMSNSFGLISLCPPF